MCSHLPRSESLPFWETKEAAVAKEFLDWLFPDDEMKTNAERLQKASHCTNLASLLIQRLSAHPIPQAAQTAEAVAREIASELERRCLELDWGNKQSFKNLVQEVLQRHGY